MPHARDVSVTPLGNDARHLGRTLNAPEIHERNHVGLIMRDRRVIIVRTKLYY
jgi:hypothetical protein